MNEIHAAKGFKTGALPTPRYALARATPFLVPVEAPPPQVIVVPPKLSMWNNQTWGCCVSSEEAFAKAAYSVMNGLPETFITDETVMTFCRKYDLLNGAYLEDVLKKMKADGFHQDGQTYTDGSYATVDYSNETALQAAIAIGPVKIGIDSSALPNDAGSHNGWHASGGTPGQFHNEDHCVGLCSYGPSAALFAALGVPMPSGFPATGYMLFTWSTIGVVDYRWIMSAVGEAWVRNPTTPGVTPAPGPQPGPPVKPQDSKFIGQSVPGTMVAGKTYSVSLTFLNTGALSWIPLGGYGLGSQSPTDNVIWGTGRVLFEGDSVPTGGQKVFTFDVVAPAKVGEYKFKWKLVQDGVTWFGEPSQALLIEVTEAPPTPTPGTTIVVPQAGTYQLMASGGQKKMAMAAPKLPALPWLEIMQLLALAVKDGPLVMALATELVAAIRAGTLNAATIQALVAKYGQGVKVIVADILRILGVAMPAMEDKAGAA